MHGDCVGGAWARCGRWSEAGAAVGMRQNAECKQTICAPCYLFTLESNVNTLIDLRDKSLVSTTAGGAICGGCGARGGGWEGRGGDFLMRLEILVGGEGSAGSGRGRGGAKGRSTDFALL